jgi:hypothetical protein
MFVSMRVPECPAVAASTLLGFHPRLARARNQLLTVAIYGCQGERFAITDVDLHCKRSAGEQYDG